MKLKNLYVRDELKQPLQLALVSMAITGLTNKKITINRMSTNLAQIVTAPPGFGKSDCMDYIEAMQQLIEPTTTCESFTTAAYLAYKLREIEPPTPAGDDANDKQLAASASELIAYQKREQTVHRLSIVKDEATVIKQLYKDQSYSQQAYLLNQLIDGKQASYTTSRTTDVNKLVDLHAVSLFFLVTGLQGESIFTHDHFKDGSAYRYFQTKILSDKFAYSKQTDVSRYYNQLRAARFQTLAQTVNYYYKAAESFLSDCDYLNCYNFDIPENDKINEAIDRLLTTPQHVKGVELEFLSSFKSKAMAMLYKLALPALVLHGTVEFTSDVVDWLLTTWEAWVVANKDDIGVAQDCEQAATDLALSKLKEAGEQGLAESAIRYHLTRGGLDGTKRREALREIRELHTRLKVGGKWIYFYSETEVDKPQLPTASQPPEVQLPSSLETTTLIATATASGVNPELGRRHNELLKLAVKLARLSPNLMPTLIKEQARSCGYNDEKDLALIIRDAFKYAEQEPQLKSEEVVTASIEEIKAQEPTTRYLSVFPNKESRQATVLSCDESELESYVLAQADEPEVKKMDQKLLFIGAFEACWRDTQHIQRIDALVLDCDGSDKGEYDLLVSEVKKIRSSGFCYKTASWDKRGGLRVVIPFSTDIKSFRAYSRCLAEYLVKVVQGLKVDNSTHAPARCYFVPRKELL